MLFLLKAGGELFVLLKCTCVEVGGIKKERCMKHLSMAGVQGFEPQLTDSESAVLPLNDTPLACLTLSVRVSAGKMLRGMHMLQHAIL